MLNNLVHIDLIGFVGFDGCYRKKIWWPLPDLNWGPIDYESTALTTELRGQIRCVIIGDGVMSVYPQNRVNALGFYPLKP